MKSLRNPTTIACALMCVATVLLTTLIGSHAQNTGTIYACVKKNNGQLRVASSSGQCNPSENEISWSSNNNGDHAFDHFKQYTFNVAPPTQLQVINYTPSFQLPKKNTPIRIHINVSGIYQLDENNNSVGLSPANIENVVFQDTITNLESSLNGPAAEFGNSAGYSNLTIYFQPDPENSGMFHVGLIPLSESVRFASSPLKVTVTMWY